MITFLKQYKNVSFLLFAWLEIGRYLVKCLSIELND